jgi:hypothetical protein
VLEQRAGQRVEPAALAGEQAYDPRVRFVDGPPHLRVDQLLGLFADLGHAREQRPGCAVAGDHCQRPDRLGHTPPTDHVARDLGQLLDVRLRACGDLAEHDFLGHAPAQRDVDASQQLPVLVAEAIRVRRREGHPQRHPARDDRDLSHRVGALGEHADHRVTGLVIGGAAAVCLAHHDLPLGAEHDPLERIGEVGFLDVLVLPASRQQCRLVDQVGEVGADHPGRRRRNPAQIDVRGDRHSARVHLENLATPVSIGWLHRHPAVEPARPQQRRIEHLGTVRRGDHDHARRRVEPVHLCQDLVQRLLALVVAAAVAGDARGP